MDKFSNEKNIGICAMKLHISSHTIVTITVYRSPTGNTTYFLHNLGTALDQVYNKAVDIILCGDFSINCLSDNQNKQALYSLLNSYSLYSIIDFTVIHNNSNTMTDNILINKFKNENYSVHPLINGLSVHDAQVLSLPDIIIPDDLNEFYTYMNISKYSLKEFQTSLSYEA